MLNNFKFFLLYLFFCILMITPWIAIAQAPIRSIFKSNELKNKEIYSERILNSHSYLIMQFYQKLSENQRDIDLIRGKLQENQHQLSQLIENQNKIDQQINKLNNLCKVFFSSSEKNTSISNQAKNIKIKCETIHNDEKIHYNEAISLMFEKQEIDQAIKSFKNFIKNYPDSIYQPNANYLMGKLSYNKNKKNDAIYYFSFVVKNYPKYSKSSDSLLKIGMIMQEKNQNNKAKSIYYQVKKLYPNSNSAKQAQKLLKNL